MTSAIVRSLSATRTPTLPPATHTNCLVIGGPEVLIVDPASRTMPEHAFGFPDERAVIDAFCRRVTQLDPDVLTGWNVCDFDLAVRLISASWESITAMVT